MWNNTKEKEREKKRATCSGIGILKNSKGPFPSLLFLSSRLLRPGVVSRASTPSPPFALPPAPYSPTLRTEIDAGNAISSGSSAFILWCTFSVRPDDFSRANLRICINTIGMDSRGNSSGSRDSKLQPEVCRRSYYFDTIQGHEMESSLRNLPSVLITLTEGMWKSAREEANRIARLNDEYNGLRLALTSIRHFHCELRNLIPFVIFPYSYSYRSNTWSRNHCYFSLVAKRIQKTWKRRTFQYFAYLIETLQQAKDFDCYDIKHLFQEINFSSLNQFFDFYSAILNIFPRLRLTK